MLFILTVLCLALCGGQLVQAAAFVAASHTTFDTSASNLATAQSPLPTVEDTALPLHVPSLTSLAPISRITTPPSWQRLELRQRCWNDQGFSVDCAVWTGYRYTWGPATNPYDYWSGAGGRGDGGGGIVNDAPKSSRSPSHQSLLLQAFASVAFVGLMAVL